ncbi:MAG: biopolymer transporter ExbD [Spirochaetes bacterium]|nr:biopolymer transporter ExbD [Spirochaetota bacterium]
MTVDSEDSGVVTGINVTPLVDITLVLLIIFMVTAHFVNDAALKIQLPKAAAAETVQDTPLTLSVAKDGKMQIAGQELDRAALVARLARAVAANPGVRVVVAADESLVYRDIVVLLDAVKAAGVARVALSAEKK